MRRQIEPKFDKKEDNQKKISPFLLFFLLLGAVGFFLASARMSSHSPVPPATISAYSPETEALVNKHLHLTSQDQYLREKMMNAQNSYMAPQVGDSLWPKISPKKDLGVDHSPDRDENTAFDDLNRYPKELRYTNPDQIIQEQIVEEDIRKKTELEDRQEYARQFVENARRNGYAIKLNEDLVIVSVRSIAPNAVPAGGAAR